MKTTTRLHSRSPAGRPAAEPDRQARESNVDSFADARPEALVQLRLAAAIDASAKLMAQRRAVEAVQSSPRLVDGRPMRGNDLRDATQLQADLEEGEMQLEVASEMRRRKDSEQEPSQGRSDATQPGRESESRPIHTGLPDNLKAGVEHLSGMSMNHVKVHYNSSQPAQLNALAYAQGAEIHVAPGQERHLPHEAWHVVQQAQGRVRPTAQAKGVAINSDASLEREADVMGSRALQMRRPAAPRELPIQRSAAPVQRSIGLEVEVAVPVDELSTAEEDDLRDAAGDNRDQVPVMPPLNLMGLRKKKVNYTRGNGPKPSNGNYRAEVDHDPRVNSDKMPAFPYRDMNNSALLEIVTEPKKDKGEFDAAMDDVETFVGDVNTRTGNLTRHSHDPYGSGHNLGPMDYPDLGPMPREASHSWNGSIQVNIGIDMREYASLAKWYAKSTYADPSKAQAHDRGDYVAVKKKILEAVDIGREIPKWISKRVTKAEKAEMGNMRGIRGWATHMALYLLGGKGGLPDGSTAKNITPILMKSPNDVAIYYGMTAQEGDYYLDHRAEIVGRLINRTGRNDLDPEDPLSGHIVEGHGDEGDLDDLSGYSGDVLFAGAPILGEQPVGPERDDVDVANTVSGERGGAVVEFRNLPGFYDGPARWRQVGHDFLREAENRNKRGGKKPDKLSKLQGPEWD